jgi:hypothetical protein
VIAALLSLSIRRRTPARPATSETTPVAPPGDEVSVMS